MQTIIYKNTQNNNCAEAYPCNNFDFLQKITDKNVTNLIRFLNTALEYIRGCIIYFSKLTDNFDDGLT